MTTIFPAFRLARWNAMDAPITPAPRITTSAVIVLASLREPFLESRFMSRKPQTIYRRERGVQLGLGAGFQWPVLGPQFCGSCSRRGLLQSAFLPVTQHLVCRIVSGCTRDATAAMLAS